MHNTYTTNSYEETQRLGEEFAKTLNPGDVITLYGDLGAGKTTFMQGLAKGLGIMHRIISPTFIIMRKYEVHGEEARIKKLYHIDLYRTETEDDLQGIGLPEILGDTQGIVAVEWPEKMGTLLPHERWEVRLGTVSENEREVSIKKYE